ncbi:MAG: hypothetical protein WA712_03545, partial [Pseudolabrys sp.]
WCRPRNRDRLRNRLVAEKNETTDDRAPCVVEACLERLSVCMDVAEEPTHITPPVPASRPNSATFL